MNPLKVIYSILFVLAACLSCATGQTLSPLAKKPDWQKLDAYQQTITKEQFQFLLQKVYAPHGGWEPYIEIGENAAVIKPRPDVAFTLRFASTGTEKKSPRYWKTKGELPPLEKEKPLQGLKIALDPGHLGGSWAKMEERWFKLGNAKPVAEGDLTLYTAKLLAKQLRELGAQVYLTRSKTGPVTDLRPSKLRKAAAKELTVEKKTGTPEAILQESNLLFYRVAEIRGRAELINEKIKPDLVICLHFNAEAWGDEKKPTLTDVNHMHFVVAGAFAPPELAREDQLHDMLIKLLNKSFFEEVAVTDVVATRMVSATGLPSYAYHGDNAVRVNDNPYIWGRNLLASRLYQCPVIFAEPYVMNSNEVFKRIQMGQYSGKKMINGISRQSIYNEYVNGLVNGLVEYYSKR